MSIGGFGGLMIWFVENWLEKVEWLLVLLLCIWVSNVLIVGFVVVVYL